ncbi:MAG TPA: multicopper oxidase domain-containing protein [Pyrinomonadaceae bacterium]|nr:multicopper oxidase domain-containing protein [Pyrinomonadaceae bacterium]
MNNGKQAHHSPRNLKARRVEAGRASEPASSRRSFTVKAVGVFAALVLAAIAAQSHRFAPPAGAKLLDPPPAAAAAPAPAQNLGSPDFTNPNEVRYRAAEKRLRMVMTMLNGTYTIPNVGTAVLRQYRGWDASQPAPNLTGDQIAPGPTLRARLGDSVEISFLNKIDDSKFSYTFDTNSQPGRSSFGCDQSGTIYPGKDLFPNCFHGSSTANIHFHGTHTSPDGLGDNVLVQVMPQANQKDWTPTFNKIFDSGKIPQEWKDMPESYRDEQMDLIKKHDDASAAAARKNNLLPPGSLYEANKQMIAAGEWPQYIMGAFPNFFRIPDYSSGNWKAGQAPGTHWYHAHKHGSTSLHILNGLAGALVIESSQPGGYDHVIRKFYGWGDSYGEHEKIMVFQQFDPTQNLERAGAGGKGIKQVLINGKLTPTITMRAGDVQLWRLINATVGNKAGIIVGNDPGESGDDLLEVKGFNFKQTAQDGVQFSRETYQNQPFLNSRAVGGQVPGGFRLAGGNRADLLVQAPKTAGVYTFQSDGTTLFFVKVVSGTPPPLPNGAFPSKTQWADMPRFLRDLRVPGPKDEKNPNSPVKFQWEAGRVQAAPTPSPSPGSTNNDPPHFMINNKQFGQTGEIVDQCMPLNGLQDWVLENWTSVAHPFHIHINPFQIIRIDTPTAQNKYTTFKPPKDFIWQDVIAIPAGVISPDGKQITPGKVTIRQTYLDFTGTFVLHCHILAHEDRGMMQLVRVVPADKYPGSCQNAVPDHH